MAVALYGACICVPVIYMTYHQRRPIRKIWRSMSRDERAAVITFEPKDVRHHERGAC